MSLADKSGLKQEDLLDVLGLGAMANPMFGEQPALCGCGTAWLCPAAASASSTVRLAMALLHNLVQWLTPCLVSCLHYVAVYSGSITYLLTYSLTYMAHITELRDANHQHAGIYGP
jgi:hypothetical protein